MKKGDLYAMNVHIRPDGNDRFVVVEHSAWDSCWRLQFPEAITAREGTIMAWPSNCRPEWEERNENRWSYSWRTTPTYADEVRAMDHRDSAGNAQYSKFFIGVTVRTEIACRSSELCLSLTLTNESSQTVHAVSCDGGCWQARSKAFTAGEEVAQSFVMVNGNMVSMASLPRTVAIRCMYRCDPAAYDGKGEWFWGRSSAVIDAPAILGAISRDGTRSLVIGYDAATSGLANSDGHHCLHSSPFFGDIAPGESVRRVGYVLFGSDIHEIATALRSRLTRVKPQESSNQGVQATR